MHLATGADDDTLIIWQLKQGMSNFGSTEYSTQWTKI